MYIKVKVTPDSKKEVFEKINEDTYKISTKEKPEKNLANIRVLELLSAKLNLEKGSLKIITGHHSKNKIIYIKE